MEEEKEKEEEEEEQEIERERERRCSATTCLLIIPLFLLLHSLLTILNQKKGGRECSTTPSPSFRHRLAILIKKRRRKGSVAPFHPLLLHSALTILVKKEVGKG